MTSTSSDMSMLAESMVSDISVEDGCRVANPSEDEVENLRALLDRSIHEIHYLAAARKTTRERRA